MCEPISRKGVYYMLRRINTFLCMSSLQKRLFFEALFLSLKSNYYLRFFPATYQVRTQQFRNSAERTATISVILIRRAISLANKYSLWENKCRHQALMAQWMLTSYNLHCEIYVGIKINHLGQMEGHAWTKSNGVFVTGTCVEEEYEVI